MAILHLYHGSTETIPRPIHGFGKETNDYGSGFYLTEDVELASEWACSKGLKGVVNHYIIDTSMLKVINLNSGEYNILNWVDILIQNRGVRGSTTVMQRSMEYIHRNFSIDISRYDAIRGYRADDSYFSFTRAFLSNQISIQQLSKAMKMGNLGDQFVLKSPLAFDIIEYIESFEVDPTTYHTRYSDRDTKAREDFRKELEMDDFDGIFIRDIIREGMGGDDVRI